MWEKAIELGKQLAKMHESHMFDFMELSQLLVRGHAHSDSNINSVQQPRKHNMSTFLSQWHQQLMLSESQRQFLALSRSMLALFVVIYLLLVQKITTHLVNADGSALL